MLRAIRLGPVDIGKKSGFTLISLLQSSLDMPRPWSKKAEQNVRPPRAVGVIAYSNSLG
jgi:hypothetical protein